MHIGSSTPQPSHAKVTCSGSCECLPSNDTFSGSISDGPSTYENGSACKWVIAAEDSISLSFKRFDTERGYDHVTINRCESPACLLPHRLARLSGSLISMSKVYTSSSGYLQIVFEANSNVTHAGFEAEWSIPGVGCQHSQPATILHFDVNTWQVSTEKGANCTLKV